MNVQIPLKYDEFLAALGGLTATGTEWALNTEAVDTRVVGAIMLKSDWSVCPYLAVDRAFRLQHRAIAGIKRGEQPMLEIIFKAADNREGHDPDVRRNLLEACGLASAL